jgi:Zn finger protein HypA/HybF involved in hydrogenase expression
MTEDAVQVRCPTCNATFAAEGEWRLAKCPHCGGIVMRMTDDSAYD